MPGMKSRSLRALQAVLAALFTGLGILRMHGFSRTALAADALAGLGFLALAASCVIAASASVPRGVRLSESSPIGRYLSIASVTLLAMAIVLRLSD